MRTDNELIKEFQEGKEAAFNELVDRYLSSTYGFFTKFTDSKEEAENAITEQGGIEEIKWAEGYHKDEPVEVYANDYNGDYYDGLEDPVKIAECVPYRDRDGVYYDDPEWSTNEFEWTKTGDEKSETKKDDDTMEVPF